eukprot:jgi/Astpho2/795/Aster-00651
MLRRCTLGAVRNGHMRVRLAASKTSTASGGSPTAPHETQRYQVPPQVPNSQTKAWIPAQVMLLSKAHMFVANGIIFAKPWAFNRDMDPHDNAADAAAGSS